MERDCLALLGSALALCLAVPASAMTQDVDESELDDLDKSVPPPPVKIEPAGAVELRDAVRRIAMRPTDSYALADAGYASLKLGDADAAFNFFTRAGNLQPADPRIKAGLASAMVRRENPFEALRLFDEAVKLGGNERNFAMDRAIAFDLLGNFERAQLDYQNARVFGANDELVRRQAVSLSLLGKNAEADAMLYPLLQRDDPEAWRARSFMLAARGEIKDAEKIALSFLTEAEARRLDYYFRQMPRLTPAQQAAALHFGNFPLGSNIGQDSEQVRSVASAMGVKPRPPAGAGRLVPAGEQLGAKTGKGRKPEKPRKPAAPDVRTANRGGAVPTIATATAQAAVDRAAVAVPRSISASQLPPPEAARPLVKILLPAAKPTVIAVSTPLPASVAVASVPKPSIPDAVAAAKAPVSVPQTPAPVFRPVAMPPSIPTPAVADSPAPAAVLAKIEELPAIGAPVFATPAAAPSPTPTQVPSQTPTIVQASQAPAKSVADVAVPAPPSSAPSQTVSTAVVANAPKPTPTPTPVLTPPPISVADGPIIAKVEVIAPKTAPAPVLIDPVKVDAPVVPAPKPDPVGPSFAALDPAVTNKAAVPDATVVATPPAAQSPLVTPPSVAQTPSPSNGALPQGPNADGSVMKAPDSPVTAPPTIVEATGPTPPQSATPTPPQTAQPEIIFSSSAAVPKPEPVAETSKLDLGSVIDAIDIPVEETQRKVAPVDLKTIKPVPAKVDAAKGGKDVKTPSHPARIWVQIATGSDLAGLSFDYRKNAKKSPALFTNLNGYTAAWNKSRRLLVGPFTDMKSAKKWEGDFRKGGGDGFVWQSSAGVEVDPLKGK